MKKLAVLAAFVAIAAMVLAGSASANHSWGKYHWARTSNPFTLVLHNNTGSPWSSMVGTASSNWNASTGPSTVLNTTTNTSGKQPAGTCDPTLGRVEVCNDDYGNTGWLGVAQIWVYRGGSHIAQATVEFNDYYFSGAGSGYAYNNSQEQLHVVCQEIGHTFGLDHQDTSGASLDTCMDYFHNPAGNTLSTKPNPGDFGELTCIYDPNYKRQTVPSYVATAPVPYTHTCKGTGHLDGSNSVGAAGSYFPGARASFAPGTKVAVDQYVDHLPDGGLLVTWVTWANQ